MQKAVEKKETRFDVAAVRKDFPALGQLVRGKPLVYFDNGATSQKPVSAIQATDEFYSQYNSNVHRAIHALSDRSTRAYEQSRRTVKAFLNAQHEHEIIFTKGTTDGINLVASSFGRKFLSEGDEVLLSEMEHHSNIVPWQLICEQRGAKIRVIPVTDSGELDMQAFFGMLNERTKLVAVAHVSNTLGTINPVKEIVRQAHLYNIPVLLDGAQAAPHLQLDVRALDCDFYLFSAHKVFGPTGTGVLYGKEKWLDAMPPYQGGGDMIKTVTFEKTTYNVLPWKFEAGTPNIAGVIGMGAALEYLSKLDADQLHLHETELLNTATTLLKNIEGVRIVGEAPEKVAVVSFLAEGTHPSDLGTLLDIEGIAIRSGHHCTQPLMNRYGIPGTARASFAFYNTIEEVKFLSECLVKSLKMLR